MEVGGTVDGDATEGSSNGTFLILALWRTTECWLGLLRCGCGISSMLLVVVMFAIGEKEKGSQVKTVKPKPQSFKKTLKRKLG